MCGEQNGTDTSADIVRFKSGLIILFRRHLAAWLAIFSFPAFMYGCGFLEEKTLEKPRTTDSSDHP